MLACTLPVHQQETARANLGESEQGMNVQGSSAGLQASCGSQAMT